MRMTRQINLSSRGAFSGDVSGSLLIAGRSLRMTEGEIVSKIFLESTCIYSNCGKYRGKYCGRNSHIRIRA